MLYFEGCQLNLPATSMLVWQAMAKACQPCRHPCSIMVHIKAAFGNQPPSSEAYLDQKVDEVHKR